MIDGGFAERRDATTGGEACCALSLKNVRSAGLTTRRQLASLWRQVSWLVWVFWGAGSLAVAATSVDAQDLPGVPVAPMPESPLPSAEPRIVAELPNVLVITADSTVGDSVRVIVERDFNFSDQLKMIVLDSLSQAALWEAADSVVYGDAAEYGAAYVVRIGRTGSGARVTLFDVAGKRVVHASNFVVGWDSVGGAPRMDVHRMADIVQEWITGARGISASRIAYIAGQSLHVIDADGTGDTALTTQGVALSPAWHPRGTAIVYNDLTAAGTQIVKVDLVTGISKTFTATRRGLNITPTFTPSGDSVIYASAGGQDSWLVISSASGKGKARVLRMQHAKEMHDIAAPLFSPDGKQIAFVASQPSYPQIYTMDVRGTHVKRVVPPTAKLRNERTAPDWSPDGNSIIYQQQNKKFQVWVAHLKDGVADTVTRVTSQGENEDPAWAPDGRHVVLTSDRGGSKQLWVLDLVSGRWRQLTTGDRDRLASWSPRLARR